MSPPLPPERDLLKRAAAAWGRDGGLGWDGRPAGQRIVCRICGRGLDHPHRKERGDTRVAAQ